MIKLSEGQKVVMFKKDIMETYNRLSKDKKQPNSDFEVKFGNKEESIFTDDFLLAMLFTSI